MPESDRVLLLYNSYPKAGVERAQNSAGDYYDRLREVPALEEQALYQFQAVTVGGTGWVDRVQAAAVTPSFFRLLRASPRLGRAFTEDEAAGPLELRALAAPGRRASARRARPAHPGKPPHDHRGHAQGVLLPAARGPALAALARARARQREMATRLALGAGPWQLARQLIAEGLALVARESGTMLAGGFAVGLAGSYGSISQGRSQERGARWRTSSAK